MVTNSYFFSFIYHLFRSTFFLSFLCLMNIFFWDLLFFMLFFLFDESFAFISSFLCWLDWLDQVFCLRFVVRWIFYSQIYFSFCWCFVLRFFSILTNTKNVTTSHFHFFHSSTIFSDLLFLLTRCVRSRFLTQIYCWMYFFFSYVLFCGDLFFALRLLMTFTNKKRQQILQHDLFVDSDLFDQKVDVLFWDSSAPWQIQKM